MADAALAATASALEELKVLERRERELFQKVKVLEAGGEANKLSTSTNNEGDDEQGAKRRAVAASSEPDPEPKSTSRLSSIIGARPANAGERPVVPPADEQQKSRNKRMFGALIMGTLQKAQTELKSDSKLTRRQEIDKELQAKANEEREEVRRQAAAEREAAAKELEEVKALKAEKQAAVLAARKAHYDGLYAKFRKTETTPPLYWRPKMKDSSATPPPAAAMVPAVESKDEGKQDDADHSHKR